MNPNLYGGQIVYYRAGRFGRCRHGHTLELPCWRCGVWHPFKFAAHTLRALRA